MTAAPLGPPAPRASRSTRTIAAIAVVVLIVGAGVWWWRAHRTGVEFSARFGAAVGVYAGSDVRILGVPSGKVDAVTPHGTYVTVRMHLDPDVSVRADTYAVVISPNLVSDRYIQLTGTYDSGPKLADGATIGRDRTRTPVELDELTRNLTELTTALGPSGANANGALSRLLDTGAANLGGNGKALNDTITQLSESGRALDGSKDDLFATIRRLSTFTSTLKAHDAALGSVNRNLAAVSTTFSDDRQSFADAVRELGTALSLVQRFVQQNRDGLTSNVAKLNTVAGSLAAKRASLAQALRAAPLLLQNFLNAYDPQHNLLRGRANLNELTIWAGTGRRATASTTGTAGTDSTSTAPPTLLPSVDSAGGSR